ncbi:MAG TPA: ATP-binding protein [Candidatus Obscuribacterales bacterium]
MKVLVAEDDAVSRRLLEATLSKEGYEVVLARDGQEAWEALQNEDSPRIAILDWMMPGMDGLEVCRRLRKMNRPDYVYIVLLTAKSHREDLLEGMRAGADDYLVKPCDDQELKVRIRVGLRIVELQRELLERSQIIQDLVYALSHDLRTPLLALGITMNQALDGSFGELPEKYRAVLANALHSNEELLRLAETLLMVARYEANHMSELSEEIDLFSLAQACSTELEPLWQRKALTVQVMQEGSSAIIHGSRQELRRVLINLIDNSVKYTPSNGRIDITVRGGDAGVSVSVADNGYGVPEADRAALFSRFWRSGKVERGAGTGLGLYLCRRIVEAHGGSIRYSQQSGEQGSVFTFELPRRRSKVGIGER